MISYPKRAVKAMLKVKYENFIKVRDYVLAKYQHKNGGFSGIYYEFDYQGPCLKSTETAVKYILNLYIPEIGNWGEVVVPEVNDGVPYY